MEVTQYPTWLANVVSVAKKDRKIRICVDYRDLNKVIQKDNFPFTKDNCAKHEVQSFLNCYAGSSDPDGRGRCTKDSFHYVFGCV